MSPLQPFGKVRSGFEELVAYTPGMDLGPDEGALAWQDYQLARLVRRSVSVAGKGHPLAAPGDYVVHREWEYLPDCTCGFVSDCERHSILTYAEREAARALYDSPVEVGREGIGGFAAGQAEETVLALRVAGYPVDRP